MHLAPVRRHLIPLDSDFANGLEGLRVEFPGPAALFAIAVALGKKTIVRTKTSHGAREIDDNLLAQMAKQCKLSNGDFGLLVECPLSRDEYEAKLIATGVVSAT